MLQIRSEAAAVTCYVVRCTFYYDLLQYAVYHYLFLRSTLYYDVPVTTMYPLLRCTLYCDVPVTTLYPLLRCNLYCDVPVTTIYPLIRCSLYYDIDVPVTTMYPLFWCIIDYHVPLFRYAISRCAQFYDTLFISVYFRYNLVRAPCSDRVHFSNSCALKCQ